MRNFIRNIIDQLRGFIFGDTRETIGGAVVGDTIPVFDEAAPEIVPGRFDTVALAPAGILFKGIRYDSPALREMLSRMSPGDTVKVKIMDPDDASRILVWDSTARPQPQWITVPATSAATNLPFADRARLRDFARAQQLPFATDDDRSEAWKRLKHHWEELSEKPVILAAGDIKAAHDRVLAHIEDVPFAVSEKRPQARKPSKPALAKAKRAKARKTAAAKTKAPTRVSSVKRK